MPYFDYLARALLDTDAEFIHPRRKCVTCRNERINELFGEEPPVRSTIKESVDTKRLRRFTYIDEE